MRILHTSDWHVGRTFHGTDLLAEQEAVLGHLARVVADEEVDVVLVAGDVWDRAVPSADAVRVVTRALARLREAGARLVLTPGNHDSAARLGAFGEFAEAGGLYLRTTVDTVDRPVLLPDEHGEVAVYGIPYLEPEVARHALGVPGARGHTGVLTEAMRRVREDLTARPEGTRSVVLAHAFVTGGEASESERTIAVGGVEQVPGSVFDGVDYVALGHLHGPQRLAEHLRYSGSPLAYSFSEAAHRKSVWLVDLDAGGLSAVRRHELPVPRRLATVRGTLDELLADPAHEGLADCYLSVTLTDRVRPVDAMRKLRERFPHTVHLDWEPEGGTATVLRYAEAVRGRSDAEIGRTFLADCRGAPPTEREDALLVRALETAGKGDPEQDGDPR
ncbi:exodeoxyribonuclease I subunit D [Prauserella shujinwangii]|uniref:Nuclease SbcCD subunit D n=1 Tax=Prauserella shujinwangii TaxID=1453103 RepID=A0A2T0LY12_9PSEU|nr:exonuclease SbcCD subunit D [Prauserella shujinwangii]PRX48997.1 exodeoxyribonuclease I subunit D [Prauserella shujinwangii]